MRKNNGDKSKARQASTNVSIRQRRAWKRLVNYARRTALSKACTSSDRTGCPTGQMANLSVEEVDNMGDLNIISGQSKRQYSILS